MPVRQQRQVAPLLLWAGGAAVVVIIAWVALMLLLPGVVPSLIASSPTATPEPPSPEGRISFVRMNAQGSHDLFVVDPDGRRQQQITHDVSIEGSTSWSPDGRYMIAQAGISGISTIIRIAVDSDNRATETVQLTADIKADSVWPAWSPDGSMVAFQSKRDGGDYQVFVMDRNGNGKRRLSDGKGYAGQPSWAPDGKSVLYVEGAKPDVGVTKEVYSADVATGTSRKITSLGKDISKPIWTGDGKNIILLEGQSDRVSTITVLNSDGTGERTLGDAARSSSPAISPDGTKLAYYYVSMTQPTGSFIYVVPLSGGTPTNITPSTTDNYLPTWSPDGTKLAWASIPVGIEAHKIVVANADGSDIHVVSAGPGDDYQPAWTAPVGSAQQ